MVSARITTPSTLKIGRGRWAIPARVFCNKKIKDKIQRLGKDLETSLTRLQTRTTETNLQLLLSEFKTKIVEITHKHEKQPNQW